MRIATAAALLGIAAAVGFAVVASRETQQRDAEAPAARAVARPLASPAASAAGVPTTERQRPAAAGGVAILASAARAQAVVTGVVSDVASIDVHGWRAVLRVDRVLVGTVRLGEALTFGWEELSTTRQVRFAADQHVLLVLDALPTQSLWRKRFPTGDRAAAMVVAGAGDAFLPDPDGQTLDLLEHYLPMAARARDGAPGTRKLAEIVADGHPAVAHEALTLLEATPSRVDLLDAEGAAELLAAARNPGREPEDRRAVLRLAAAHVLPGTADTARALTGPDSRVRADAYRALAALPGELPADRAESLLTDADPELRAVGVELAHGAAARGRLVAMVRDDPAPAVRLAAGHQLLAADSAEAIPDVIGLLDDPDPLVRNGIAESIGAVGDPAVAPLRVVIDGGSERAALAAVLALARTGRKGGAMLAAIAASHERETVRAFARLALGEALGHK